MKANISGSRRDREAGKCLLLVRISSVKQQQESDSPEHQVRRGLACADRYGFAEDQVLILSEVWSGRKEDRPTLEQAFELVEKHQIAYLFIFDIDRLTRAGVSHYETLKARFKSLGCDIVDVKGIIQPERNTLEGTGSTFGNDFTYDWSVFAPSEKAELQEAQAAKDEARKILSRTIPVQIQNAQLGRTNRWAPYGFKNCKIIDESGKPQASKEIFEDEAFYVRRLYQGVAAGQNIRTLCDELNRLGFKTRELKRWSTDHSRIIGKWGGNPLTPRVAREMVRRVCYAGFILEKWTHGFPVTANHEGIVSLKQWNAANADKSMLVASESSPTGWELVDIREAKKKRAYQQTRPDFPFKSLMACSECGKNFKAGFSRSQNGKKFGYYHCGRGHKQISISPAKLDDLLRDSLKELKFAPELADRFEKIIREVWIEKVGGLNRHLEKTTRELADLREQCDGIFEKIKLANSPVIIARLEKDYEDLERRISLLSATRNQDEFDERDMNRVIAQARYLVEHLDELIVDAQSEPLRGIFWSLVYPEQPTLEKLQNRTATYSPLVRLKAGSNSEKYSLVEPTVLWWNQLGEELIRWATLLKLHRDLVTPVLRP